MKILPLLDLVSDDGVPDIVVNSSVNTFIKGLFFFVLLGIVAVILVAHWITHKYPKSDTASEEEQKLAPSLLPNCESKEIQELCEKIRRLDPTDLSKADGFVEALLTAEKYKASPKTTDSNDSNK